MSELYTQHLVKLLAKENLSLTFSSTVDTAAIDLKKRTIMVNSFLNRFNTNVLAFERLLCHEVGHALYSDAEEWLDKTKKFDKQLVNAFEDIRIENLLKIKFPGLRKLFSTGFYELDKLMAEKGGVSLANGIDENSHILDKINVYFKSNYLHPINFSDEEFAYIQKLKQFTDSEDLEPLIIEFLQRFGSKEEKLDKSKDRTKSEDNSDEFENQSNDSEDFDDFNQSIDESTTKSINSSSSLEAQANLKNTLSYQEDDIYSQLKNNESRGKKEFDLAEIKQPKPNIISNSVITKFIKDALNLDVETASPVGPNVKKELIDNDIIEIKKDLKDTEKAAALLYTEFERQKNARNFRSQHQVKTGELNLNKLSNYKTSSAIFKHAIIKPQQKNHEVLVLLDWSTSIRNNLIDLIKESITLVTFCKKANIPCSVYAFIDNNNIKYLLESLSQNESLRDPCLVEMLSTTSTTLLEDCSNLLMLGYILSDGYHMGYYNPLRRNLAKLRYLSLSKTPLQYALFNLPSLLGNEVNNNKRICLAIISDGESDSVRIYRKHSDTGETILSNTSFIDPLTKSITSFTNKNLFLYSRLKTAFPTLSILTIHIADNVRHAIYNNGFLESPSELYAEINDRLSKSNVYFKKFDLYDHLIIKTKEVKLDIDPTKKLAKSTANKLLQSGIHPMSKYIYKQIAACFS